jgi:AraC family transcriptional regulator
MSVTNRALFVIERNLSDDLTLERIAERCDVSRFHLAHAFGAATGLSVMEYVRKRRLTEAAYVLASGARDILGVALDSLYASHEAFSRAFKAQLGKTPEDVRKSQGTDGLKLIAAIPHLESKIMKLAEPRIVGAGELLFVGTRAHVSFEAMHTIPKLWADFMKGPYGEIAHKIAEPPVGLTTAYDENGLAYMCAAGVEKFGNLPGPCIKLTVPPSTYAVFAHDGHVTELGATYEAIWNDWFPASGRQPAEAPSIERHNSTFDPRTGNGGVTIWIPIRG